MSVQSLNEDSTVRGVLEFLRQLNYSDKGINILQEIDVPPSYTAVPMEQAMREPVQQLGVQQLGVQQPSPKANLPSAPPHEQVQQTVRSQQPLRGNPPRPQGVPPHEQVQQTVRSQQQVRGNPPRPQGAPPHEQVQQTVRSQQPVRGNPPRPQVPREFYMNANEARRANERNIPGDVIFFYPYGKDMAYPRSPIRITCQHCLARVVTNVEDQINGCAIFLMIITFLLCFPLGICFLIGRGSGYIHKCPNCGQTVGTCYT